MLDHAKQLSSNVDKILQKLEKLQKENDQLKRDLEAKSEELHSFKNSDNFTNIVSGIDPDGEDAVRLKARIDENIQDLDKCIALLSNK